MANRFKNTVESIWEAYHHLDDEDLNQEESLEREKLIELCFTICDEYHDEISYLEPREQWV